MSKRASYPVIGLSKAIDDIKKLWKEAQHAPLTAEAAVRSLGYGSLNGAARSRLAALKHFGLTEDAGKEQVRVSGAGKIIAVHPDGLEKTKAIQQAAKSPKLFQDLLPNYLNASDGVLRGFLVTNKGYSDEAAKAAIRAFRDTVRFAKLSEPSVDPSREEDAILDSEDGNGDDDVDGVGQKKDRVPPAKNRIVDEVSFKLSPNSKVEIVFTSDKPTTQEDFDLMMQMLNIQKLAFPKAADLPKEPHWMDGFIYTSMPPPRKPDPNRNSKDDVWAKEGAKAIWHTKDSDIPIVVISPSKEADDGREYVRIVGSETRVPLDEIEFSD